MYVFFLIILLLILSMVKPRLFAFPPYLSGFENQWFGLCFFNNGDFDSFLVKWWKFNSISENSTLQLACWLFVLSISFLLTCFLFWRFSCLPLVHLLLRLSARLLWLALFRRSLWCPPPLLLLSLYLRLIFIPLLHNFSIFLHLFPIFSLLFDSRELFKLGRNGERWKSCAEVV